MPPRTKSPLGQSSGEDTHAHVQGRGVSPRRSARFALATVPSTPIASTSRTVLAHSPNRSPSHSHSSTPSPSARILRQRPSAPTPTPNRKTLADAAPTVVAVTTKKRKSPDLAEAGMRKRSRVRCPAEPHTTPTTRKGKGKAASPPSGPSASSLPPSSVSASPSASRSGFSSSSSAAQNPHTKIIDMASVPRRMTRRTARQMQMQMQMYAGASSQTHKQSHTALPALTIPSPMPNSSPSSPSSASNNNSNNNNANPMTLRSTHGRGATRGSSPAPGRLDEIDMGVPSSPLTSPVRERGEMVWVKREPEEVRLAVVPVTEAKMVEVDDKMGMQDADAEVLSLSSSSTSQGSQPPNPNSSRAEAEAEADEEDKQKQGTSADVEMPLDLTPAAVDAGEAAGGDVAMPAASSPNTNMASSSAAPAVVLSMPSTLTPASPPSPTSPPLGGPTPYSRALSPEDLAPSRFAPPLLPPPAAGVDTGVTGVQDALVLPLPLDAGMGFPGGVGFGAMGGVGVGGVGMGLGEMGSIAPGPPVSPDWPLPHAPFPLSSSSSASALASSGGVSAQAGPGFAHTTGYASSSTSALGYPSAFAPHASTSTSTSTAFHSPAPHQQPHQQHAHQFTSPAERQTRAVEWGALLERRRRAGERALADAREAEERRRALERWTEEYGVPPGRGAPVCWVLDAGEGGAGGDVEMPMSVQGAREEGQQQQQDGELERAQELEREQESEGEEVDAGMYAPEDAFSEDDYGRMRRRSPLCIVSAPPLAFSAPAVSTPSPLMLAADVPFTSAEQQRNGEQEQRHHGQDGGQAEGQEQQGPRTDLVYEAPQVLYPQQQQNDDLGPDPVTRMSTGWGPWKIACRLRVWDVKNRYTGGLIRSLVAQEADDYFSARGLPHPDALLFMDEEYYDWELEESASEGDGDGSGSGEESLEGESLIEQSFALDPNPADADADADTLDADDRKHMTADGEEMDLGTGMGGVLSSFYVAPSPPGSPTSTTLQHQLQHAGFPHQMPLPLPPPPLASVRVPVLRHFFTDIPIAPAEGVARGRGTPVDPARKAAWGGGRAEEIEAVGVGRGTLERRQPHPRPRPHPMYMAMARSAEAGAYGHAGDRPESVEGVADADLPPLPRLRESGEPPMLPMRGLRDLVRSMRGDEDGGTEEERKERDRREMSEAFEPDEAVWQEFLKSVGVEGASTSASSSGAQNGQEAMDVDAQRDAMDAGDGEDDDSSGGSGGTSGGVSLGLPSTHNNSAASSLSSSTGSALSTGVGMGVEMGIGMFGMAMGAMGMGWFGGPASPPGAVPVGDGERERERESSLSFALGV